MKQKVKTSLAFAKNILTTGAISETSEEVENEVCKLLPRNKAIKVVEFGIGHGNITRKILSNISKDSTLHAFEVNPEFCKHVRNTIDDQRLQVINDSAEHVQNYFDTQIDAVIATIPFSFFSKEKSRSIIQNSYDLLKEDGFYSQALYTKFNFKKFQKVFEKAELVVVNKLPPAYVYHCKK